MIQSVTIKAIVMVVLLSGCSEDEMCTETPAGTYQLTVEDRGGDCGASFVQSFIIEIEGTGLATFSEPQTCGSESGSGSTSTCLFDITVDQRTEPGLVLADIYYYASPNDPRNRDCPDACQHHFEARYEQ